jgi:hypothetical protein
MRRRGRSRLISLLAALVFVIATTWYITKGQPSIRSIPNPQSILLKKPKSATSRSGSADPQTPIFLESSDSHPIRTLLTAAQKDFDQLKARQSKSLGDAVKEYQRRYDINPPPKFDIWYSFAKKRNVQLIDEFDTIHHALVPFWGLKPAIIRARAREAMGYDNTLIGVLIRNGNITKMEGGREWMQKALVGMTSEFRQYLPDMDLCFNVHDEPRVILQHDDLSRLVEKAKTVTMPAARAAKNLRNEFSPRAADMNNGNIINEISYTRFNFFPHQATWTHSRMSCPIDSPVRSLEEVGEVPDENARYALGPLGFIYNQTAFSDVCLSPSFSTSYGIFQGGNSFNIAQDLMPIFSQSKLSTYQDILYPSPWYWYDKVPYDEKLDITWKEKEDRLYWRGATTGGYSRYGSWRRQHRQRFVSKVNSQDHVKILANKAGEGQKPDWQPKDVQMSTYKEVFDVKFVEVGQCDKGDCTAQNEFFTVRSKRPLAETWMSKYLVDIDGNGFSGRFYAFLRSRSMVYKLAIFREWHEEWLKPWLHFVPLSLKGDDWLEAVRWFAGEAEGKAEAVKMAETSKDWAGKALRNEDLEVWFFRLLLE